MSLSMPLQLASRFDAVLTTIKGRTRITGYNTVVLDSPDPFKEGFRVGDQWHMAK